MEGTLNRVVTYLIAVVIFFVYPVYITFEKKDDITHAIVSKATHLFVDNIRTKGYISQGMYNDYTRIVYSTGNKYDIKLLHSKKRYDPVVYCYAPVSMGDRSDPNIQVTDELTYEEYKNLGENGTIRVTGNRGAKTYKKRERNYTFYEGWKQSTKVSREYFSNDYIMNKLAPKFMGEMIVPATASAEAKNGNGIPETSDLRKYKMSVGDTFEVSIRNINTTVSTMLFATLTGRRADYGMPKIYIKYGGVVRNEIATVNLTEAFANGEAEENTRDSNIQNQLITSSSDIGKEYNFVFSAKKEKITLEPGTYKITASGAQGGGAIEDNIAGGQGGVTQGVINIEEKQTLTINVGGKGKDAKKSYTFTPNSNSSKDAMRVTGGYNGGGNSSGIAGAGGGGATEVILENGEILMTAAGGGGNTYSNLEKYKSISAGGNTSAENLTNTKDGESACIIRHVSSFENDEAGAGAGYKGGKVIHGDNPRCSYGGSNYINKPLFMSTSEIGGQSQGDGSVKIVRIN